MNSTIKQLLRCVVFAGAIVGLAGCIVNTVRVNCPGRADRTGKPCCGEQQPVPPEDLWPAPGSYGEVIDTTGSSGLLNVHINSFYGGNGGQTCFPTNNGWNKYFPLPKYFLGPGVVPNAQSYTNVENLSSVTVRTCDPTNGTTLETGIVIYEEFHPGTDKKCATNSPACLASTKLTINQRNMASGKRYRATVFYKSATLGSRTNVQVLWSYP